MAALEETLPAVRGALPGRASTATSACWSRSTALFNAQQTRVGVRLAEQANRVTLYKVLGGGAR